MSTKQEQSTFINKGFHPELKGRPALKGKGSPPDEKWFYFDFYGSEEEFKEATAILNKSHLLIKTSKHRIDGRRLIRRLERFMQSKKTSKQVHNDS